MVEEEVSRAEWEKVAPLDARFQMEGGKSEGKDFDHVYNP